MTGQTATRRKHSDGWLFAFLAVVFLGSCGWYWHDAQRSSGATNQRLTLEKGYRPKGFSNTTDETDAPPDTIDPRRFRVVEDGVMEDTATGIRVKVKDAKKGDSNLLPLDALRKIFSINDDLRSDLRNGTGARPSRLRVTSIKVDAPVLPIGLDADKALAVPRRADVTGWWSGGYAPGEVGPTVIVGHYDTKSAPGVFEHLQDVESGDLVMIDDSDGAEFIYRITRIDRLGKSVFPTDEVYGPTTQSELRLVTCGGKFNQKTGHYVDNVIAYADFFGFRPAARIAATSGTDVAEIDTVGPSPYVTDAASTTGPAPTSISRTGTPETSSSTVLPTQSAATSTTATSTTATSTTATSTTATSTTARPHVSGSPTPTTTTEPSPSASSSVPPLVSAPGSTAPETATPTPATDGPVTSPPPTGVPPAGPGDSVIATPTGGLSVSTVVGPISGSTPFDPAASDKGNSASELRGP
jgi:sortase (surface protein transpeptidase)